MGCKSDPAITSAAMCHRHTLRLLTLSLQKIFDTTYKEHRWTYPPVPGENGYIGTVASWIGAGQASYFDPRRADPNETYSFPETNLFRNAQASNAYHEFWWFGKLGNGSQIEPGKYQ
jgi:hypothetical protein